MRLPAMAFVLAALSACSAAPPPRCWCPANTNAAALCTGKPMTVDGYLVYTGADYLAAYWLGRQQGFLGADE